MSPTTRNLTRFIPGKEKRPESLIPDETYIVKVKGFPWWPVMILDNAQVTQNTKDSLKKQKRNIKGYYFHYCHTFE
ncbi:hypothetical protein BDC45DRAFT_509977 [Circinella umbellata]|nr:hypothetical protein BDC45DRAFT_509977 [Circinella umbellata]